MGVICVLVPIREPMPDRRDACPTNLETVSGPYSAGDGSAVLLRFCLGLFFLGGIKAGISA